MPPMTVATGTPAAAQLSTHRDRAAALLALAEKSVGLGFEGALALEAEALLAGDG